MKPMIFTLREKPRQTLDLSALTPDSLAAAGGKRRIKNIQLPLGPAKVPLGDVFSLSGDNPEDIELRRTTERVVRIGAAMTRGRITVKAHGGDELGCRMKGGAIRVAGDCGNRLGCNMSWGRIEVEGNAGDYVGGGAPTATRGMTDGLITVWGNAGNRVGDKMRRGMILVAGEVADFTGAGMIAGTIVALGKSGKLPGYGMKRGSIILGKRPGQLGATLSDCGILKMEYLRLFFKQLSRMGSRYRFFRDFGPEVHLYAGDMANGGKGELMVLIHPPPSYLRPAPK